MEEAHEYILSLLVSHYKEKSNIKDTSINGIVKINNAENHIHNLENVYTQLGGDIKYLNLVKVMVK